MFLIALAASAHAAEASYDKGFTIEDGDWKLKISSRIQARYTYESPTDDFAASESAFSIPRARLKLSGDAGPRLGYYFQADFGKGQAALKDYFVTYDVSDGVELVAGQHKRPFSRQQLTSSSSLQFSERALTDEAFGAGRDIGLQLRSVSSDGGLGWAVGLYNGSGETWMSPLAVGRVSYDSANFKGYKEPDLKGGGLRWSLGAGAQSEFDVDADDDSGVAASVDYIIKVNGLSHTSALYVGTAQNGAAFTDQAYTGMGFHTQAGFAVNGTIEPVVRFGQLAPDGADNTQEIGAGLNVYSDRGHDSKLQVSAVYTTTAGAGEIGGTAQYQFQF